MYELSSWWLANVAIDRVRASSHGALSGRLTRARLGVLADLPVRRVTSEQVQEWQTSLLHSQRPLSPSTVSDTRTTLRQVLDCAIDHGLLATNPVPKVKGPKSEKRPGRHLSPNEAKQLVGACAKARYGVVVALLFAQGWRISEALGLAWQDVDLDAATVVVRRAVVQAKGAGRTLGPPKTAGATGVHLLTPGVIARLRAHRLVQIAERRDAVDPSGFAHTYEGEKLDLIFTSEDGGLVARQAVDKLMRSKADELGIDSTSLVRTSAGALGDDGVCGVAVEVLASPVVDRGGVWIGVAGGNFGRRGAVRRHRVRP